MDILFCYMGHFEVIDFFLSNDIIQGESIPFFLTWKGENPKKIILEYEGFQSLVELYNAKYSENIPEHNRVIIYGFEIPNYLGGLLSTQISNIPIYIGSVSVTIFDADNNVMTLKETRKIYTTILKISSIPNELYLDGEDPRNKVCVELKGETTVFIKVEELNENQCSIDVPYDIKEMLFNVTKSINESLNNLKEKYPKYIPTLNLLLGVHEEKMSLLQYMEKFNDEIKNSFEDDDFVEAIINVFLFTIFEQTSLKDRIIRPWKEYLECYSYNKAYFSNPMLILDVPENKSILAIKLVVRDLLNQECGEALVIKVPVFKSTENCKLQIPLRNIFSFERIKNDIPVIRH